MPNTRWADGNPNPNVKPDAMNVTSAATMTTKYGGHLFHMCLMQPMQPRYCSKQLIQGHYSHNAGQTQN